MLTYLLPPSSLYPSIHTQCIYRSPHMSSATTSQSKETPPPSSPLAGEGRKTKLEEEEEEGQRGGPIRRLSYAPSASRPSLGNCYISWDLVELVCMYDLLTYLPTYLPPYPTYLPTYLQARVLSWISFPIGYGVVMSGGSYALMVNYKGRPGRKLGVIWPMLDR